MKTLIVNKDFENKKLSSYLQYQFDGLSINTIYKAIRKKDVIVNGVRIKDNISVHENDEITIYIVDSLLYKKIEIEIVYEDNNIVIFNKPSGISVLTNSSHQRSFTEVVQNYYGTIFVEPCHRLDTNTSGLLLFAKNKEALKILLNKFKNQEIDKHYICTVYGIPKKDRETLNSYLFKDSKKSMVYISDKPKKGYQKICTSYLVISKNVKENTSILDVELHTGKTHQIRAHLAHIGLPIIGDREIWNK